MFSWVEKLKVVSIAHQGRARHALPCQSSGTVRTKKAKREHFTERSGPLVCYRKAYERRSCTENLTWGNKKVVFYKKKGESRSKVHETVLPPVQALRRAARLPDPGKCPGATHESVTLLVGQNGGEDYKQTLKNQNSLTGYIHKD